MNTHAHKIEKFHFQITVGNMELQQVNGKSSAKTALFLTQLAKEENNILQISQLHVAGDILGHCETPLKYGLFVWVLCLFPCLFPFLSFFQD